MSATHLLEQGVDLQYTQELLSYSRLETAMTYTDIQKDYLLKNKRPLDRALAGFKKTPPDKRNKNIGISGDISK